jgi:hypothetical protein
MDADRILWQGTSVVTRHASTDGGAMSMSGERYSSTDGKQSIFSIDDLKNHGRDLRLAAAKAAHTTPLTQPRAVPEPGFGFTITGLSVLGVVLILGGLFVVISAQPTALGDAVVGGVLIVNGFNALLAATVIAVLRKR